MYCCIYTIASEPIIVYTLNMDKLILWDEPKRQANLDKHGLDFADLTLEFFLGAVILGAHSERMAAIGTLHDGTVTTIFAELGREAISIISLRPASKKERKVYDQKV